MVMPEMSVMRESCCAERRASRIERCATETATAHSHSAALEATTMEAAGKSTTAVEATAETATAMAATEATAMAATSAATATTTRESGTCSKCQRAGKGCDCDHMFEHCATPERMRPRCAKPMPCFDTDIDRFKH